MALFFNFEQVVNASAGALASLRTLSDPALNTSMSRSVVALTAAELWQEIPQAACWLVSRFLANIWQLWGLV